MRQRRHLNSLSKLITQKWDVPKLEGLGPFLSTIYSGKHRTLPKTRILPETTSL